MNQTLLGDGWWNLLKEEFSKSYMERLKSFLLEEYKNKSTVIYPEPYNIFKAFKLCQPDEVKVIIIGQDVYHNGQADGLAFSSKHSFSRPKSLQVIFKEVDKQIMKSTNGEDFSGNFKGHDLTCWATQGVLLLNSCLTVRKGIPNSHQGKGWEEFIEVVLRLLIADPKPKVFVTWGNSAVNVLSKAADDHTIGHLWLSSGHPATVLYNRDTFSGNKHFIKINEYLQDNGRDPIDWRVTRQEDEFSRKS